MYLSVFMQLRSCSILSSLSTFSKIIRDLLLRQFLFLIPRAVRGAHHLTISTTYSSTQHDLFWLLIGVFIIVLIPYSSSSRRRSQLTEHHIYIFHFKFLLCNAAMSYTAAEAITHTAIYKEQFLSSNYWYCSWGSEAAAQQEIVLNKDPCITRNGDRGASILLSGSSSLH